MNPTPPQSPDHFLTPPRSSRTSDAPHLDVRPCPRCGLPFVGEFELGDAEVVCPGCSLVYEPGPARRDRIEQWIEDGHEALGTQGLETVDDLLEAAGCLLDKCCSYDIVGPILFRAADGKYYVGNVEFVIDEADPDYVQEVLERQKESEGE